MNKKIFSLILILASVAAGIYFRFYPVFLPYFDIIAAQEVRWNETSAVQKSVQDKYPGVSGVASDKIAAQLLKDHLKSSDAEIKQKIARRSRELKDRYRDKDGSFYLNGIDSYYWLRLLQNLLANGHIGNRVVLGNEYDDLIAGVIDPATKKNVHLWLGVAFYKTASFFDRDIPLEGALFYVPIFLSVLIAVFSFTTAKRLGANDLGAFFASIAVNISPFLLSRSVGEWFDTDIYNVFFPLFIFGFLIYALTAQKRLYRVIFSALSGLFLAFYASTWKGWWFIFDIILLSGALFLLNQKMSQAEEKTDDTLIKSQAFSFGLFVVLSSFFVICWNGFFVWKDFIAEPLRLSSILKATQPSLWPNVYLTVAELTAAKPFDVMNALGGSVLFLGSLIGLLYILLAEHGFRDNRYGFGFLCLTLWIASTFYAATEALRFALLLVVPVGLLFGVVVSKCYDVAGRLFTRVLKKTYAVIASCVLVFFLSCYLIFYMSLVHYQLLSAVPQMDTYWHRTLEKIQKETPKEAIIDSWWDFGHWFTAIAGRRVLFDGMTQDTPYAYWIATGLLSDNEKEFVGILRMINTSDNKAADILGNTEEISAADSIRMVKKALVMNKEEARRYLGERLSPEKTEVLLAYLFPKDLPPVYFIVSYDMPVKVGAISYIGNWDFAKADMWQKKDRLSKDDFIAYGIKKYGLSKQEAQARYLEVCFLNKDEAKPWFSNVIGYGSAMSASRQDGKLLFFENGLVVNLDNNHAAVSSESPQVRGIPASLLFLENDVLKEVPQKEANLPWSALLVKDKDKYKSQLLNTALAKSMLLRLYYFKGAGLKNFKLWYETVDDKGNAIYVYQVIWNK